MKVRLIGFVGILVIVAALIAAPVSAGGSTSGSSAVLGNPSSYASIALNSTTVVLGPGGVMPPGASSSNQSLGINVTCNERYTITVADNTGRPAATLGYMGNYTSPIYGNSTVTGLNTTLTAPLQSAGTTNATASVTGSTITPPITTGSTLYSSAQPSNNLILAPNTFTQPVTYYDPVLPTSSTYRIDLLFTLTYP